jgi:hypothetical protein
MYLFRPRLLEAMRLAHWYLGRPGTGLIPTQSGTPVETHGEAKMSRLHQVGFAGSIFVIYSMVGPLLRWAISPAIEFRANVSPSLGDFINDLAVLLWPSWYLGVFEYSLGYSGALAIMLISHISFHALLGFLAGYLVGSLRAVLALYLAFAAALFYFAIYRTGFDLSSFNPFSLGVALLIGAVPFLLARRLTVESPH